MMPGMIEAGDTMLKNNHIKDRVLSVLLIAIEIASESETESEMNIEWENEIVGMRLCV